MKAKKFVKVTGKQVDKNGAVVAQATAVVPYEPCSTVALPEVPPFNTSVWLDGDTGYSLTTIRFTVNGLEYFYHHHYDFEDEKIHAECEIKDCNMIFDFERIELTKNADYAIAMKVRKVGPDEKIDESCSKFFGKPCVPESLKEPYPDDGVFFAQIRCSDLKELDPDCRLPHHGYLYFFLDAEMYPSDQLHMMVDHSLEEPKYVIDDYNEDCNIKGLTEAYVITFEKAEADYDGTKLLGIPSNDIDERDDKNGLLLQFDPLDFDVPFLATLDGYAYVFFGDDPQKPFAGVDYVAWGS